MKQTNLFISTILILSLDLATGLAGLDIKISPLKSTYLLLEPALVHYQVKNSGPNSVRFWQSEISNGFIVMDSKNKRYHSNFTGSYLGPPPTFQPGESVENTVDINFYGKKVSNFSLSEALPIGKYRVYLELKCGTDKVGKSNTIEIEIIEPSRSEKIVMSLMLEADSLRLLKQKEASYRKMLEVCRNFPQSVYNEYAYFRAGIMYPLDDKRELVELSREFIDKYPNSRYMYSPLLIFLDYYQSKKDKLGYTQELNSLIQKYPGTRISKLAEESLKVIAKLKF